MATVSARGGLATVDPMQNPIMTGMQQGLGLAQNMMMLPYARQQALADIQAKQAQADYYSGRGAAGYGMGNKYNAQAEQLVPAQSEYYQGRANQANTQADVNQAAAGQLIPAKALAEEQKAALNQAQADYYKQGANSKQGFYKFLLDNKDKYGVDDGLIDQSIAAGLLYGAPAQVKEDAAATIAENSGNTRLTNNLEAQRFKQVTPAQAQNRITAYKAIDTYFDTQLPKYIPSLQYYSGPEGVARWKSDKAYAMATGKSPNDEYTNYKTFVTEVLPAGADQLRKAWGTSVDKDVFNQLQGMIGFKDSWDQAQSNPQLVLEKVGALRSAMNNELKAYQSFSGQSYGGATGGNTGATSPEDAQLQKDLSSIQSTMENQKDQGKNSPPPGMSKEQFMAWYKKNGSK